MEAPVAATLAEQLAGLEQLDHAGLVAAWQRLYGRTPPRLHRPLMILVLAHRIQEKALGGLKPATRRRLHKIAEDARLGREPPVLHSKPGTVLIREWQGTTHHVQVVEQGVLYRDQHYRSLSHVAKVITGAHWSGPRFFGLTRRHEAA